MSDCGEHDDNRHWLTPYKQGHTSSRLLADNILYCTYMYRINKDLALECGNGCSHRGEADNVLNIISCQEFDHLLRLGTEDSMLSFTVFNWLAIMPHCL